MLREKLQEIRRDIARSRTVTLTVPNKFTFKDHDIHDFNGFLSFFNWNINECPVRIDLTECTTANYQALSLLVLYAWHLKENGCRVTFIESPEPVGASAMWKKMGARGLFSVLPHTGQRFKGDSFKPLFAVRTTDDFRQVISAAESYITGRTIENHWPGTFVLVALRIEDNPEFLLHKIMQDFREAADAEQRNADHTEEDKKFYFGVNNFFGSHAEDKEAAIRFRDRRLFPAIASEKIIVIDFADVKSAPHSFLSALIASPIKSLGLAAYKRIKVVNATPEIRETIDFIFDDNTETEDDHKQKGGQTDLPF